MTLKNHEIYDHATALLEEFGVDCNIKLPVKINFYLQKNINTLKSLAIEIEQARTAILQSHGTPNEDGSYTFSNEEAAMVSAEMSDLSQLEQDISIYPLKLENFDGIDLTYKQMSAIMFMIEE